MGDGNGKIGQGSRTDKTETDAVEKANSVALTNNLKIKLAGFEASPVSNHTLEKNAWYSR